MPTPDDAPAAVPDDSASDSDMTRHIPLVEIDTEEMSADDVAAVENLPLGSAMLLVQRGPDAGARFLLDDVVVTVGRHPDSDIFLDDISVSRRHATFTRAEAGYVVADLGSLNGTYVHRDRISSEVTLAGGDEVQIGKYRLIYFAGASKGSA